VIFKTKFVANFSFAHPWNESCSVSMVMESRSSGDTNRRTLQTEEKKSTKMRKQLFACFSFHQHSTVTITNLSQSWSHVL
jgi:hypothetical protein